MQQDNAFYIGIFATILGSYFWLMFLRKRDRYEPEPIKSLLFVLVIGGAASTYFAGQGNAIINGLSDIKFAEMLANNGVISISQVLGLFLPSAFVEEICKYTAAFYLIRHCKEVNEPVDGIIYAVTVGLGFSLFENFLYVGQHGGMIAFPRLLFAVPLHMATAAIWGIYLSRTLAKGQQFSYWAGFPLMLLAVCLHAFWNTSTVMLGGFFYLLSPLVLLFCMKKIDAFIGEMHSYSPFR